MARNRLNEDSVNTTARKFGLMIRIKRREQSLTLDELATASGVCKATISALEHGRNRNPTQKTISALGTALGCSQDELLFLRAGEPVAVEKDVSGLNLLSNTNPALFDQLKSVAYLPGDKQKALQTYLAQLLEEKPK